MPFMQQLEPFRVKPIIARKDFATLLNWLADEGIVPSFQYQKGIRGAGFDAFARYVCRANPDVCGNLSQPVDLYDKPVKVAPG